MIRAVDGPLGSVAGHAPEDMEYQGSTMRLRDTWVAVRASVRGVLEGITLADIASDHLPESIGRLLDGTDAWVAALEHVVEELAVLADAVHADALEQALRGEVGARRVGQHAGQARLRRAPTRAPPSAPRSRSPGRARPR